MTRYFLVEVDTDLPNLDTDLLFTEMSLILSQSPAFGHVTIEAVGELEQVEESVATQ